jgi:tetratricopeptide (TPR) repeat protein
LLSLPPKEVKKAEPAEGEVVLTAGRKSLNRLDLYIKLVAAVFVIIVVAFGAYYGYTRYLMGSQTYESVEMKKAKQAIIDNPQNSDARARLGVLYMQLGQNDNALFQFDQALKIAKDHQEALLYSGIVYMNRNQYDKALTFFDKLIKYYRNTALAKTNTFLEQAYYYGGVAHWKQKRLDKALEYITDALDIKASSADSLLIMGRIYLDKKDYDQAIVAFNKALEFDPKYADALYGLGLAYEGKSNKAEALKNYQAALTAKPDFKLADDAIKRLSAK